MINYNKKLRELLKQGIAFDYTEDARKTDEIYDRECLNSIKLDQLLEIAFLDSKYLCDCWEKKVVYNEYYNVLDNDSNHFKIRFNEKVIALEIDKDGYIGSHELLKLKSLLGTQLDSIHITELYRLLKSYSVIYQLDIKELTLIMKLNEINKELIETLGIKIDLPEKSSKQKVMTN